MHSFLLLRGVHFPPTCMQAKTFNHSHRCNCLLKPGEGTYFWFNLFLCSLSSYWFGVINEAFLTPYHSGDCRECVVLLFFTCLWCSPAQISYNVKLCKKERRKKSNDKHKKYDKNDLKWPNPKLASTSPLFSFFHIHYFVFWFGLFWCKLPFADFGIVFGDPRFPVTPNKIYRLLWLCSWIRFLSLSLFPSLPPVSFCPRSERWLWYLAHLMDSRE